jgi:hypothetical protein
MADWRLDARIAASDTDGGRTADSRRAKRGGIERRLRNGCEQHAAGRVLRVVQRSNTAWGQVSDNHRWTQHRSFAVSGKRVMVTTCRSCTTVSEGAVMGLGLRLHLAKAQWLLSRLRQLILHSHFCTCCTLAKVNG